MATSAALESPRWCARLVSEFEASDERARRVAGGLSAEQLNWQPRPGAWGVGQCLEHLLQSNEVYLPAIAAALEGREHGMVEEIRLGWFSRWFIRNYVAPNPGGTRGQAPKKIAPSTTARAEILAAFLASNQTARELVKRAGAYDVNAMRFRNPFIPLLRFTVGTGLEITSKHQSRHLLQAEGVRQSPGFP